ncbi:cellular nucleic acid-binding protein, partial [Trifolium medium]|nr:cellular nucleic acid-binding protein [Trifolium medium]
LVDKSRICDEDGKAKTSYYKVLSDKRGKGQDRGKPYGDKGKKGVESSGGRKKNSRQCYRVKVTCFNCGEEGHKSPACKKPKKT